MAGTHRARYAGFVFRRDRVPAWTASAAALALGLAGALVRRPWHDELYTLALARSSFTGILASLKLDSGPPGYYVMCHVLHLVGLNGLVALRLVSAIAVAIGVGLLVSAITRGRAWQWATGALLATHPLLVRASGEARQYGVLFALAAASAIVLNRPVGTKRGWLLALILAAACWVHALGLVLVGGVFVAGVAFPASQRRRIWLAGLGALILCLPWLPVMMRQPAGALAWMAHGWSQIPKLARWILPLAEPSPAAPPSPFVALTALPIVVAAAGMAVWAIIVAAGAITGRHVGAHLLVWSSAGLTLVAASLVLRPVYAPGRADVLFIPAAAFVVTAASRWRRWVLSGLILLAVAGAAVSAASLGAWARQPASPAVRAASALRQLSRPGDTVVTTGWWLLDVRYALGSRAAQLDWLTFPRSSARHPGWYDDRAAEGAEAEVPVLTQQLRATLAAGRRVWLLRSPLLLSDRLLTPAADACGLVPLASERPFWVLWGPPRLGRADPG